MAYTIGIFATSNDTAPCDSRLFEENEELLNMFTKFRDLKTKEQQSTSMELAEHAKTVMSTLDEGIKSLDDMDAFLTYLHEVGASHTKIPGFNRQYFWVSPLYKKTQIASHLAIFIRDIWHNINTGWTFQLSNY